MTCGCTNNKNLNDKILSDNKMLSLEDMKDKSMDEIIKLYQDGYRIETMQDYSTYCSGPIQPDRSNTLGSGNTIPLNVAYAQRVKPPSKCLASITLSLSDDPTYKNDMYVEIRSDSAGVPNGYPKSGGDIFNTIISSGSISNYPAFGDITIAVNKILSDSDVSNGIWIIVCSYFYDPYSTDSYSYHYTKTSGTGGTSAEYMAVRSGPYPWEYGAKTMNLYFKTNKQTYSVPCPTPVVSVTCPTSPITQGTTGNIASNITTLGTPGYVYKLYRDTTIIDTYPTTGTTTDTTHTFSHLFNETVGSYTFKVEVTDSCSTGAKTVASNTCPVTIQAGCPTPVVSITCPTATMSQGSIGTILSNLTTLGTPGYVYKLYRDTEPAPIVTYPVTGTTIETNHLFVHTFNESIGSHTFKVEITDSCSTGAKTVASNTCSVNIQSAGGCSIPAVSVTCPTSPITQGTTGNITSNITTLGTPGYVYKLYRDTELTPIVTYPVTGTTTETNHLFVHTFNESVGSHTFKVEVTDSCTPVQTASDICPVTIQGAPPTAGAGGGMAIAAIAALAVAYLILRPKSPT